MENLKKNTPNKWRLKKVHNAKKCSLCRNLDMVVIYGRKAKKNKQNNNKPGICITNTTKETPLIFSKTLILDQVIYINMTEQITDYVKYTLRT